MTGLVLMFIILPLGAQPVIVSQPTNQVVLNGSNAWFAVSAAGSGLLTYQWQFNGTNLPSYALTVVAGGGSGGDGGPAASASLNYPFGVATDAAGDLLIADSSDNLIRKVDTNGIITTLAGNGSASFGGDGGAATSASLNNPLGLAADTAGNLYIVDSGNNRIRKVDTHGIITTVAGSATTGYGGDGGPATNASLSLPFGLAVDGAGNFYFGDYLNNRVRRVGTNGIITTFAGNTASGYTGDGVPATNTSLSLPCGLVFDPAGNLYIGDYGNNRVRMVNTNGIISTFAGTGPSYVGGDPGVATNATIQNCANLALNLFGKVLISDVQALRQVDTNGTITTLFPGFSSPAGIAVDARDYLYLSDAQNNRILKTALLGAPVWNVSPATPANAGNYDVVITDASGSITSSVVALTVNVPAFISLPPKSQVVALGSNVNFTVSAGGNAPLGYQWLSNSIPVSGANASNYSFTVSSASQPQAFSVLVSNTFGSVTSSVANLSVVVLPPGIVQPPANQVVAAGGSATFSVVASGSPPFNYQWWFMGSPLAGQTNATLALANVATNQAGGYSVSVASSYGATNSPAAILWVGSVPVITQQPVSLAVLAGGNATLSMSVSGLGPFTFQWQCNGTNVNNISNLITSVAGVVRAYGFSGDGGAATNATLNNPAGVAVDALGNIYVADASNNRVRKINPQGIITTVAGKGVQSFSGDGGLATNACLSAPQAVTVDAEGNIFIADMGNSRIRKVDTNGMITTVAGTNTMGYSGDGLAATAAALYRPYGVCLDAVGNLYISDSGNNRIRRVGTNGLISTYAGNGTATNSVDGTPAASGGLPSPAQLSFDAAGNLLVAESTTHVLRKIDSHGMVSTLAGNGTAGYAGDGGSATSAQLNHPFAAVADFLGNLYLADTYNDRIRRVDPAGFIATFAGNGGANVVADGIPATNSSVVYPYGITFDLAGNLLIADTLDNRIRKVSLSSPRLYLPALAAANAGNYSVIVASPYGSVTSLVATVTVFSPPSLITPPASQSAGLGSNATLNVTVAGTPPFTYQWQVNGVWQTPQASPAWNLINVQWADAGSYRVVVTNNYGSITSAVANLTVGVPPAILAQPNNQFLLAGNNGLLSVVVGGTGPFSYQWQCNGTNLPPIITTVAGNGSFGFSGDGGSATNARLNNPYGVAVDAAGNIFIADNANYRVRKVDTNGVITTVAGKGSYGYTGNGGPATNATLGPVQAVAVDPVGNVFIADYGEVRKLATNGVITDVAGTGAGGFSADGGLATSTVLFGATSVAVDGQGNVFLADYYSYRIRKVGTNGIIRTVAGFNPSGASVAGFSGDGGRATNASLSKPAGVALDALGQIFIADTDNNRVRKVDTNGIITTVWGGGTSVTNGTPGTNFALNSPAGLVLDRSNNVFLCANSRVWEMNPAGLVTTSAGSGSSFPGDYGPATSARIGARGVAVDAAGNLYIADQPGHRIRKIHLTGDPTWKILTSGPANGGIYQVVVTSPFGSTVSMPATLTVAGPPNIQSCNISHGQVNLTWNAVANLGYQLQRCDDLTATNWTNVGSPITATNVLMTTFDLPGADTQHFYRMVLWP